MDDFLLIISRIGVTTPSATLVYSHSGKD